MISLWFHSPQTPGTVKEDRPDQRKQAVKNTCILYLDIYIQSDHFGCGKLVKCPELTSLLHGMCTNPPLSSCYPDTPTFLETKKGKRLHPVWCFHASAGNFKTITIGKHSNYHLASLQCHWTEVANDNTGCLLLPAWLHMTRTHRLEASRSCDTWNRFHESNKIVRENMCLACPCYIG